MHPPGAPGPAKDQVAPVVQPAEKLDLRQVRARHALAAQIADPQSPGSAKGEALRPWRPGHTPFYMPPLAWRDPSTLMLLLAPTVDVGEELDVFSELLDWEFGLYSLDTSEANLARTQALRGFYPSAMLSPDMDRLGYVRALRESEDREIYMVDLASGAEVLYASGNEAG